MASHAGAKRRSIAHTFQTLLILFRSPHIQMLSPHIQMLHTRKEGISTYALARLRVKSSTHACVDAFSCLSTHLHTYMYMSSACLPACLPVSQGCAFLSTYRQLMCICHPHGCCILLSLSHFCACQQHTLCILHQAP